MPRPNSSQLDHWLDEEIESLVRSIEPEAEAEATPTSRAGPSGWFRHPHGTPAFGRSSRRALGRLAVRRSNLVFYAFAVAVSLALGWLIPFLDRP
jgi:hypothetical protein